MTVAAGAVFLHFAFGLDWYVSVLVSTAVAPTDPAVVFSVLGQRVGVATLAHGSGFLAVFVAGIVLGDGRAPYKREIKQFQSSLASLAEIVAFVVLGLTVDLDVLARTDVWVPGLVLGAVSAFVIRPYGIVIVVFSCWCRAASYLLSRAGRG